MRIVVVGGGIGGLATAFRLRQSLPDDAITVLEASERWGGTLRSERVDGLLLEHGPDALLRTKPAGMRLVEDLGLADEVVETRLEARRSLVARGNLLIPVPEGFYLLAPGRWLPFLGSPLISWSGKLRMALDLVLPRRPDGAPEESLAQFVRRRLGREALERIAQPLIAGITTADPERLSVAAAFPQLIAMEREHRSLLKGMRARIAESPASGARYGLFASLRDGMGRLSDRLVERLGPSCELRLKARVESIARIRDGFRLTVDGKTADCERVVVALPANAAARICAALDDDLARALGEIPYAGVAVVNLAWDRADCDPPEAAGFVVPRIEKRRLIAASFVDRKFAGRAPADRTLVRAFLGGAQDQAALELSDDELITAACRDLRVLIGAVGKPTFARVARWPKAMPQHEVGHLARVAAIRAREAAITGFSLVSNGLEGLGIPDLCAQAETAAEPLG